MTAPPRLRASRFAGAAAASAFFILWAPFVGQIRRGIRNAFPGHFVGVVGAIVAIAIASALGVALARIRERRRVRYALIVSALVFGAAYAFVTRTGNPEVDVVERFHFVEYGLLTWLFYRAWHPIDDGALYVLPVFAGLIVGTFDELFQWFIPARIGEMHDIFLNGAAIGAGLLFSIGLDPPARFTFVLPRASRVRVAQAAAAFLIALAAFLHVVHLGFEIRDPGIGSFRSRYTREDLDALARDRGRRWQTAPPLVTPPRLSREDQYLSEAAFHVQKRNEDWAVGNIAAAWRENLILERYYAPTLDLVAFKYRWPAEQRADAQTRGGSDARPYVSDAQPFPIYIWPKWMLWSAVAGAVVVIGLVQRRATG